MAKKEKFVGPVIPVRIVDGHTDEEQVNWTLMHADPSLQFRAVGTSTENDGTQFRIFQVLGIGAKKLARMFDKEYFGGDGKHYIMCNLAEIEPIKK